MELISNTDKELKEIKFLVKQLMDHLGVGATRPADVIAIKNIASKRADRFVNKKSRQG